MLMPDRTSKPRYTSVTDTLRIIDADLYLILSVRAVTIKQVCLPCMRVCHPCIRCTFLHKVGTVIQHGWIRAITSRDSHFLQPELILLAVIGEVRPLYISVVRETMPTRCRPVHTKIPGVSTKNVCSLVTASNNWVIPIAI